MKGETLETRKISAAAKRHWHHYHCKSSMKEKNKTINVCRKRFSQRILKDHFAVCLLKIISARLSHPHIMNWPYKNPSNNEGREKRKQNVIIVCNKDNATPNCVPKKYLMLKCDVTLEKITHRLSFGLSSRQRWVNFPFNDTTIENRRKIEILIDLRDVLAFSWYH